jgi:hypothetical protein
VVAALGSGMAFLDSTVFNVTLPAIQADRSTRAQDAQWVFGAETIIGGREQGDVAENRGTRSHREEKFVSSVRSGRRIGRSDGRRLRLIESAATDDVMGNQIRRQTCPFV